MRILVNEFKQEISSFNPVLGRYDDFVTTFGEPILSGHRGLATEIAGALSVFEGRPDVQLVPGYSARAITSGGTVAQADFERMAREFLDAVRRAGSVDGVYFALHGACAAEGEPDTEGYLLEETRRILGWGIPIAISLDLHGILTDRMLRHASVATVYQTYPHVDLAETGARAARLLLRLMAGEIRPVTVRVPIPALVRGDELITETGVFGKIVREAQAEERSPGGLSAGMFIGNPFTDVPELCSNAFVVTDGDAERARRVALRLAGEFWEVRERLQWPLTPLAEAVRLAAAATGRVVLMDAADATSSGASGDSNAILREMVESGFQRTALLPLVDPPAVDAAFRAGVGQTIRVPLGGALDAARFRPLEMDAYVALLSDGRFRLESFGETCDTGGSAVLRAGNYTIVAMRRPVSLFDRSPFLAHGQDPTRFDTVIVKSPHARPEFFSQGAERVIVVDAPGSSSANLITLGHTRCRRPIFPLDRNVTFAPEARVFESSHAAAGER